MSDSALIYAQNLTNIQHARLTPVVDHCEAVSDLEAIIHYKGGGRRVVTGLFSKEINRRLRKEVGGEFD